MQAAHGINMRIKFCSVLLALAGAFVAVPAQAEIIYYQLRLAGSQASAADGQAHGTLSIDSETGRIVWGFYYLDIDAPTAMHIHRGAPGVSGGVIVPLSIENKLGAGALTGTVTVELDVIAEILGGPENFYVNIHTADYPRGALRAQLGSTWTAPD